MTDEARTMSLDQPAPANEEQISEMLRLATLALKECLETDPKKLGGAVILRGTRFPLAQIFSQMADGDSVDDLADNFELDKEQLCKLLHALGPYLDHVLRREISQR